MRDDWETINLEKALKFSNGKSSPERYHKAPFNVYGSNGIIGNTSTTNAPDNCIIVGRVGTYCGSVYYSDKRCWVTDNAIKAEVINGNNAHYFYYNLINLRLNRLKVGSGQPLLNQTILNQVRTKLPPLPEQKAIAHILCTLDNKIELNRKMNETLEAMAQALFKSWFVDFDPVLDKALAAGHDIPESLQVRADKRKLVPNDKKLIHTNPKMAAAFPDRFVFTEELGWIPEGWEVKELRHFGEIIGGGTPSTKKTEYFSDKGIPWLSPRDLSGYNWKFISRGARDISNLGLQKSSAKLMSRGSVLFSSRAPIGYIAIARNDITTNQGFKSIEPRMTFLSEYLYYLLKLNKKTIESLASGSTFKEVSGSVVKSFKVISPSTVIIKKFAQLATASSDKQLIIQDLTDSLICLRDTLLPKLISGELRVPEALKIIEVQLD